MCFKLATWALYVKNLNPTDMLILAQLGKYADTYTKICWPSQTLIAKESGISRERINRGIKLLKELGLIRTFDGKKYEILTPPPPQPEAEIQKTVTSNHIERENDVILNHTPVIEGHTPVTSNHTPVIEGHNSVILNHTEYISINQSINQSKNKETRARDDFEFSESLKSDFQEFWEKYPNRVKEKYAKTAYETARKQYSHEKIMDGLARYIDAKPPDRAWMNPNNFLNDERFNDEPSNPIKTQSNNGYSSKNGYSNTNSNQPKLVSRADTALRMLSEMP